MTDIIDYTDLDVYSQSPATRGKQDQTLSLLQDQVSSQAQIIQEITNAASNSSPPTTFSGGNKIVASTATPEALVSVSTPCKFVWIGAPVSTAGAALNTKVSFVGDFSEQNIPVLMTNYEGIILAIDDANKVYVKVSANSESVNYRIFI